MGFNFNFKGFKDELAKHFSKKYVDENGNEQKGLDEHHIVTEDLIRYWFKNIHESTNGMPYTEVPYIRLKGDESITPLQIKKDVPMLIPIVHKGGKESYRVRADLYYGDIDSGDEQDEDKIDSVFEFKYHRRTRYSNCCTGTDCGSVFGDLNRLSILKNREKYFVYVFDDNMYDEYYKNKTQELFKIFKNLSVNSNNPIFVNVGKNFDSVVFGNKFPNASKGFGEIKKGAFSQFKGNCKFAEFKYDIKVLYSSEICKVDVKEWGKSKSKTFYLLICQVLDNNSKQTEN